MIDCHHEWLKPRNPGELSFEIAPDTVTFHLFETVEVQSTDTAAGDVPPAERPFRDQGAAGLS